MAGILESKETGNEQPDSVYIKVQALGGDYRVDKSSLRFTLTLSCSSSTPLFLLLGQESETNLQLTTRRCSRPCYYCHTLVLVNVCYRAENRAKCEKIYYAIAIYSRLNAFMCEKYPDTSYPAKPWARERNHGDCEVLEDKKDREMTSKTWKEE